MIMPVSLARMAVARTEIRLPGVAVVMIITATLEMGMVLSVGRYCE
jgi:hypothetical protein